MHIVQKIKSCKCKHTPCLSFTQHITHQPTVLELIEASKTLQDLYLWLKNILVTYGFGIF